MSSSKATKVAFNNNNTRDEDSVASSSSSSCAEKLDQDHSNTDTASQQHGGSDGSGKRNSIHKSILSQGVTRAVLCSKLTVYLVLLITAIVAGSVTFTLVRQQEQKNMETEFVGLAHELVLATKTSAASKFSVVQSLGIAITSYAMDRNLTFPFVTLPHYELQTRESRLLSGGEIIAYTPLVMQGNETMQWQAYAQQHSGWIQEGLIVNGFEGIVDPSPVPLEIYNHDPDIHRNRHRNRRILQESEQHQDEEEGHEEEEGHDDHGEEEEGHDPVLHAYLETISAPMWQIGPAPLNAQIVNANILSNPVFEHVALDVLIARKALISPFTTVDYLIDSVFTTIDGVKYHHEDDDDHEEGRGDVEEEHQDGEEDHGEEDGEHNEEEEEHQRARRRRRQLVKDEHDHKEEVVHIGKEEHPYSFIIAPVFENLDVMLEDERDTDGHGDTWHLEEDSGEKHLDIVGFLLLLVPWDNYFQNVLPEGKSGFHVVVDDSCGKVYTFDLHGSEGHVLGEGDLHEVKYDNIRVHASFASGTGSVENNEWLVKGHCHYIMDMYASDEFLSSYKTNKPAIYAVAVAMIFIFTLAIFAIYDWNVSRRQTMVMNKAIKTQAVVSSLFPKSVQDRIMQDVEDEVAKENKRSSRKDQLKTFLTSEGNDSDAVGNTLKTLQNSKPIADLFPEATIIFSDIVGFTAWSSTREPAQVFRLLETIYFHFDQIADRRRVFKVETVGDCYVAVAGLPDPRKDHAVVMARFARDCLFKFNELVKSLVIELGPDTEDLKLRTGLHSGAVTAGVLRSQRARFQLFGDTVNTAARMESNGAPNRIHISQETADLLTVAGKNQWVSKRDEKIKAKGKGELQTYWLEAHIGSSSRSTGSSSNKNESSEQEDTERPVQTDQVVSRNMLGLDAKHKRLVDWNVDIVKKILVEVVTRRKERGVKPTPVKEMRKLELQVQEERIVLGAVKEIVSLPKFTKGKGKLPVEVELSEQVVNQLHAYITALAAMYRQNPFHNFEHASHVTMSVVKLLSRIVAPDLNASSDEELHDHTYGLTSDPLTQFAVVISALIHDVDHPGVPNTTLVQEGSKMAAIYNNKSIAEQNSVDLAWDLLMEEDYANLRRTIYTTEEDFLRFRQLVVNIVMATDIMDKDLGAARKARWAKAFADGSMISTGNGGDDETTDYVNRKATIVMEHLIQASDVAHTMQHWHVYRKWNHRLFDEMYTAYTQGRAEKNPADSWYQGEIGFFDFYIIPLAKKLADCGVFGVSSDEYLQYAKQNRQEWEDKGKEIVAEMVESFATRTLEEQPKPKTEPIMEVATKQDKYYSAATGTLIDV